MAVRERAELADLVDHVASQLLKAEEGAAQRSKRVLALEECELELAVDIEKSSRAGLKVWILQLGGEAKKTESNTVRVKFKPARSIAYPAKDQKAGPPLGREREG